MKKTTKKKLLGEDVEPARRTGFEWTEQRGRAAALLAQAYRIDDVAREVGVSARTIDRWKTDIEFGAEVDRLSHMLGAAARAERLRIAIRTVRQETRGSTVRTRKDLLDWLRYIRDETDGVKLNLTALLDDYRQPAESGQVGSDHAEPDPGT